MSKELNELTKRLRAERCPDHVTDSVFSSIRNNKQRPVWTLGLATAGALALILILAVNFTSSPEPQRTVNPAIQKVDPARADLNTAIIYFGRGLSTTGEESGEILADSSLASLGKGLLKMHETLSATSKNNG